MSKGMITLGGALLGMTVVSAANAGLVFNGDGAGFGIVDNTTVSSDIIVGDSFELVDITISLNDITHSWIGDLVVTIEHLESGNSATLFSRVGQLGGSGFGDSSNLNGTYAFNDAFTGDLWAQAALGGSTFDIPGGDYFATGADGAVVSLGSVFGGIDIAGTWRLSIQDNAGGDTGSLGSWSLNIVGVPAPAALAMFGLAGLAPRRRRSA